MREQFCVFARMAAYPAFRPVPYREMLSLVPFDDHVPRADNGLMGSACPRAEGERCCVIG
jgi:uncharacterized protein (DUF697 family)